MRNRRQEYGMTYLEVLAAMLLFSIAMMYTSKFIEGALRINNVADRDTKAYQFAQEQFEVFKSTPWTSINSGSAVRPGGYTLTWTVSPPPNTSTFRTTCSLFVQWSDMTHEYARLLAADTTRTSHTQLRPQLFKRKLYVFMLTRMRSI